MQKRSPQPEILLPRPGGGGRLFDDESLDLLSRVLDDCFRLPGTGIRFGISGIIGLVPGVGDILTGLAACIIVVAAWFRGLPYITLVRMLVNLAIDVVIGAIPFLGDIFDIAWKANRRNYKLLTRHLAEPRRHTWRDWCVLLLMATTIALMLLAPVVVLVWLIMHFVYGLRIR
jgi:NAD/NADP transhydrogenase beta subunit